MVNRYSLAFLIALLLIPANSADVQASSSSGSPINFENVTARAGINVRHHLRTYRGRNVDVADVYSRWSGGSRRRLRQ